MMTKEEFAALSPKQRGYVVYMAGCREDEPNIPNEENPYLKGSAAASQWDEGQTVAIFEVQDNP